jgi:hypothetical protein
LTNNEGSSLDFSISVVIPGSLTHGVDAAPTDLVSVRFSIVLIDSSVAMTCASNMLIPSTNTLAGNERENILIYTIPKMAEPA